MRTMQNPFLFLTYVSRDISRDLYKDNKRQICIFISGELYLQQLLRKCPHTYLSVLAFCVLKFTILPPNIPKVGLSIGKHVTLWFLER